MTRNTVVYLRDILDNLNLAIEFVGDRTYDQFTADRKTVYAVLRCLEVVGEAAKNVPAPVRERYPSIPWKDMGSATRKATFRKLLHLSRTCPRLQVRLWNCAGHKQFHGKLYLWRSGSQGIAWIGSPNFTSGRQPSAPGGLARAGEVVLELRDACSSNVLKKIRDLFCREWARVSA
ncbi:MAG: DUF86 domain-containing protein [Candidatus Rokubacteria bacterium]|nr:DUF86 domain-containing protein [Candidatus Rokubacteria bacterium]